MDSWPLLALSTSRPSHTNVRVAVRSSKQSMAGYVQRNAAPSASILRQPISSLPHTSIRFGSSKVGNNHKRSSARAGNSQSSNISRISSRAGNSRITSRAGNSRITSRAGSRINKVLASSNISKVVRSHSTGTKAGTASSPTTPVNRPTPAGTSTHSTLRTSQFWVRLKPSEVAQSSRRALRTPRSAEGLRSKLPVALDNRRRMQTQLGRMTRCGESAGCSSGCWPAAVRPMPFRSQRSSRRRQSVLFFPPSSCITT